MAVSPGSGVRRCAVRLLEKKSGEEGRGVWSCWSAVFGRRGENNERSGDVALPETMVCDVGKKGREKRREFRRLFGGFLWLFRRRLRGDGVCRRLLLVRVNGGCRSEEITGVSWFFRRLFVAGR
ncbi:hypothetical protein HAX54_003010 [Datura stramonium]|uniref:Uncharacterized protein n=1 Tax=Datura stramonium TaxID=4076 RepID=A0ABS8T703_DATST|nr:hypothetical protein [Datura stramonium]